MPHWPCSFTEDTMLLLQKSPYRHATWCQNPEENLQDITMTISRWVAAEIMYRKTGII